MLARFLPKDVAIGVVVPMRGQFKEKRGTSLTRKVPGVITWRRFNIWMLLVISDDPTEDLLREEREELAKAESYTRVVFVLGYGGLIAMWSTSKFYLTSKFIVLSGALIITSVILFMAYEVFKTAIMSHSLSKRVDMLDGDGNIDSEKLRAWHALRHRLNRLNNAVWAPVFYGTVVTGFAGGLILLCGFVVSICRLW